MSLPLQHQIISRALVLIEDEANWTRIYVARAADGKPCACMDKSAVRFCAIGALARAANELIEASGEVGIAKAFAAEKFILKANNRPYDTLPCINDSEGHAVIVGMFKQALEARGLN
jgi:hypothetical protein